MGPLHQSAWLRLFCLGLALSPALAQPAEVGENVALRQLRGHHSSGDGQAVTSTATTGTTTTATTTTWFFQVPKCILSFTPCDCARETDCVWVSSGSSGSCQHFETGAVECGFCPFQDRCGCSQATTACDCASMQNSCTWDSLSDVCRSSSSNSVSCDDCALQNKCLGDVPAVESQTPRHQSLVEADNAELEIVVSFDIAMRVCGSGELARLWCDGSYSEAVPAAAVAVSDSTLTVDASSLLGNVLTASARRCGISVPEGALCAQEHSTTFPGIDQGTYWFYVRDTTHPTITGYIPALNERNVATVNSWFTVSFTEQVRAGDSALEATVHRLDIGQMSDVTIQLTSPYLLVDGTRLRLDLSGALASGARYSISLPAGAVVDLAGNLFAGLAEGDYQFYTAAAQIEVTVESSDGGTSVVVILAVVIGVILLAGFCAFAGLYAYKVYWLPEHEGRAYQRDVDPPNRSKQPTPVAFNPRGYGATPVKAPVKAPQSMPPGAPEVAWKGPTAGKATGPEPMWAHRSSGQGARIHPTSPTTPMGPQQSQQQTPYQQQQQQQQQQRQSPHSNQGGNNPQKESNELPFAASPKACAEVKAVEKQMRELMHAAPAERKKAYRALILEYHPDKNSSENAKEVFQFVNGAKDWFMSEA